MRPVPKRESKSCLHIEWQTTSSQLPGNPKHICATIVSSFTCEPDSESFLQANTSKDKAKSSLFQSRGKDGSVHPTFKSLDHRSFICERNKKNEVQTFQIFVLGCIESQIFHTPQENTTATTAFWVTWVKGIIQNIFSKYGWHFRCFTVILQLRIKARERAEGQLNWVPVLV